MLSKLHQLGHGIANGEQNKVANGTVSGRDMDNDKWKYNGRSKKDWEVKLRKERERKGRRFGGTGQL